MTPQEHNKYLGISHLVHGTLMCLLTLTMLGLFIGLLATGPGAPPVALIVFLSIFMGGLYGLMTVPSFVAGYGLLKRKRWARTASIVGGVTAAMNFPIGTAVCTYTFWFLFSEPGKFLYDRPQASLQPHTTNWQSGIGPSQREQQYIPPTTPPDWR